MYLFLAVFSIISICNGLSGEVELHELNNQHLSLNIDVNGGTATIVLTGDDTAWFAVGFNGTDMNNTYAVLSDYDSKDIYELKLGSGHCSPGCDKQLPITYTVNLNRIENGVRTINITRPINDNNNDYYQFPTTPGTIPLIWAFGLKGQKFENGTDMQNQGRKEINLS